MWAPMRCANRVLLDRAVVDGGRHDRAERAVDLCDRVVVQATRSQSAVPGPNVDRSDVEQERIGEHHRDVAHLVLVDLTRPRAHRVLLDPLRRVLAERASAGVRVDPQAVNHVCLDRGEPATRIGPSRTDTSLASLTVTHLRLEKSLLTWRNHWSGRRGSNSHHQLGRLRF